MNLENGLRALRTSSLVVRISAIVVLLAGVAQLVLGGIAVKQEYERIAEIEELSRQNTYYGYQLQQRAIDQQYNRSSSAFFIQGRFMPSEDSMKPDAPGLISLIVLLLSGLVFVGAALFWVFRANSNLAQVGIKSKYSPALATAAYLIPVANLFLPFESMRELHNRSHGEEEDFAHSPVEDVTAWWTAMMVGMLIFSAMIVKFALDVGTNLVIMTPIWMEFTIIAFALVLLLGSAWLFGRLTRSITAAQAEYLPQVDTSALADAAPARPTVTIIGT